MAVAKLFAHVVMGENSHTWGLRASIEFTPMNTALCTTRRSFHGGDGEARRMCGEWAGDWRWCRARGVWRHGDCDAESAIRTAGNFDWSVSAAGVDDFAVFGRTEEGAGACAYR